jgi:type I restriction enzyme, S subunit
MIEELKPYEALRPSGDPWLGDIPKHWSQKALWSMSSPRVERNPGNLPLLSVFLDRGVIPYGEGGGQVHAPSLDLSNYQVVHPGDFVLNNQQAWRGSVGVSRHHGIISPAYIVLRLNGELLPDYANYLFRSPYLVDQFVAASKGVGDIQRQVFWPFLRRVTVPIPSTTEQEAIVRFLEHANRHIDQFIRSKKQLIALLNEQKQAIIHRAVTRGLDPNVPLKESGVPWVSEVPASWQLTPNRAYLRVRKVLVGARHREYQLLSLTKRGVIIRDLSENKGKFSSDMGTSQEVRAGDLVFCLFDVPETPRTLGLSSHNGMITGAYTVMECRDLSIARFLEAFYIAMDDSKLLSPLYSGLRNTIPKDRLLGAKTPIPPAGERERILSFIAKEIRAIQAGIDRTSAEIALVQEYRSRLVADVVTGHLEVPGAAAGLPVVEPEAALTVSEGDETDIANGEAA